MKHPAKTDIAVLLLFFTRSDTFGYGRYHGLQGDC